MNDYFNFVESHGNAIIRVFLAFATAVDLVFVYAAIFDRDLPPKIATWFFGALSGQPVTMAPSNDKTSWWQWVVFALISAVPPMAWIVFEMYFGKRAG